MAAQVLLIEDNPVSLQLTRRLLADHGYTVLTAEEPARGIALVRQRRPELVICDLQLPALNGFEVLQLLRQDPSCCNIPVLAVTAFSALGDEARALAAGFCAYIRKPIEPKEFMRRVNELLPPRYAIATVCKACQISNS
jgi:CheY-like chemotaxis protein